MSREALGLIKWRDEPQPGIGIEEAEPDGEASEEQLVVGWLVRSATAVTNVKAPSLAGCPSCDPPPPGLDRQSSAAT